MVRIAWFKELSKNSLLLAGGKAANLGEMYNLGLPIPPGFVITTEAYKEHLEKTGIGKIIYEKLAFLDVEDTKTLQKIAEEIQEIILKMSPSRELWDEIVEAYEALSIEPSIKGTKAEDFVKAGRDAPYVAVRSSATAEDQLEASFAGQMATYLNVKGLKKLLAAVIACWASLFTARAIYYRDKNKFKHEKVLIAVVVQKMIDADVAGIIFSANPVTLNKEEIVIESSYGLGEAVVSGSITPDTYIVDKKKLELKERLVSKKTWMYVRDPQKMETIKADVPEEKQNVPSLSSHEIKKLAEYAVLVEEHYKSPQDLEFALEKGRIYITQTRPITTLREKSVAEKKEETTGEIEITDATLLVSGLPASPGVGKGKVVLVHDISDLKKVQKGDVLVARMTSPDYVPTMKRASAIVTDSGGVTAHAAIVSREMSIPCIVGTDIGTQKLKEGMFITVDATKGKVYEGNVRIAVEKEEPVLRIKTKVKVKVNLDLPELAEHAAATGADGVGLLRSEFINMQNREHPVSMIRSGKTEEFVSHLVNGLKIICKAFKDKSVWYRTLDARTDEFRNLPGGEDEPKEDNPMMGWRSIRRSLDQPELLKAEYEAIKRVHKAGYTNIGIMLPLVTHVEQVRDAKNIFFKSTGIEPVKDIAFGIMIETPAAVQMIEELCKEGISFISLGTNDLTQFTFACDRNSARVAKWADEMHPAIQRQVHRVIQTCKKYRVETSICGQAGSRVDMAKFLFSEGIDSMSANPDAVNTIRKTVAQLEGLLKNGGNGNGKKTS